MTDDSRDRRPPAEAAAPVWNNAPEPRTAAEAAEGRAATEAAVAVVANLADGLVPLGGLAVRIVGDIVMHEPVPGAPVLGQVVVPADLHTAQPMPRALEGGAACSHCGRATPASELAVSGEGYHCRDCAMVRVPIEVVALPDPATLRPARGRWIVGIAIGLVLVGAVVVALLVRGDRADAAALRAAYPVAAEPAPALALAVKAEQWRRGRPRVRETLRRFYPAALGDLSPAGPCRWQLASPTIVAPDAVHPQRFAARGAFVDEVVRYIDEVVAAGRRGRFATAGEADVLAAVLAGPIVVTTSGGPRAADGSVREAGVAYAFDPATGTLACAGEFAATGSDSAELEHDVHRRINAGWREVVGAAPGG